MCKTDADRSNIESRIVSLVDRWSAMPMEAEMPEACRHVVDAVSRQATSSSEGGKRLRALLMLAAYDAFDGPCRYAQRHARRRLRA